MAKGNNARNATNADTNATPPASPANATHNATNANDVPSLLAALANAKGNVAEGKRIRRALRSQGYFGGTRSRANDIVRGATRSTYDPNTTNA